MAMSDLAREEILAHVSKMDQRTKETLQPFLSEPPADRWIRDVLFVYWHYLIEVLEHKTPSDEAEKTLLDHLSPLVPEDCRADLGDVEEALAGMFGERGYNFLGGYTMPYLGPYIWKRMEKRVFEVELPDRVQPATVFFMHDFLMIGWKHFETYGVRCAGGWAKSSEPPWEDGLYCVSERYDLERLDENPVFQISLLKHEAQHLADKEDFPQLDGASLEYRAKLVELIYHQSIDGRFKDIIRDARDARRKPEDQHAASSQRILGELSQLVFGEPHVEDEDEWRAIDYARLSEGAQQLLAEHTRQLQSESS